MVKLSEINPIPPNLEKRFTQALDPIVALADRFNINPNTFTTLGLVMSFVAAYAMSTGSIRAASLFILIAGLGDTLDGRLARHSGKETKFGALYDSVLDRYSEVLFFFGMAFYFIKTGWYLTSVAVAVGLGGSLMVSYVRARAEGLGFDCKVGLMQRAERLLLLGIGGLIHLYALAGAIWIIAVLSNFTAVQRILHVWEKDSGH